MSADVAGVQVEINEVTLLERMIICKQTEDVHTNVLSQMIAYEFVTRYSIDEHIAKLRAAYGKKCKLMMDCMDKYFPAGIGRWTES